MAAIKIQIPIPSRALKYAWLFLCILVVVQFSLAPPVRSEDLNVLLVGNSYIYSNNMNEMIQALLQESNKADGNNNHMDDVSVVPYFGGGAQLEQHDSVELRSTLTQRPWTFVMIQEQSQIPGFWGTYVSSIFETSVAAIVDIDNMVNNITGADTILLMTWGRRFGDHHNPFLFSNFSIMQNRLAEGYYRYRDTISTLDRPIKIAPIGLAFKLIYDTLMAQGVTPEDNGTDFSILYSESDDSHPSIYGSYLGACVICATVGNDPQTLNWAPLGMNSNLRNYLQSVATATVANFDQGHYAHNSSEQTNNDYEDQLTSFTEIMIMIVFDHYSDEIGWNLRNKRHNDTIVDFVAGTYPWWLYGRRTIEEIFHLERGASYQFNITDTYGDGLCCDYGPGYFNISTLGNGENITLASGDVFGAELSTDFTVP